MHKHIQVTVPVLFYSISLLLHIGNEYAFRGGSCVFIPFEKESTLKEEKHLLHLRAMLTFRVYIFFPEVI